MTTFLISLLITLPILCGSMPHDNGVIYKKLPKLRYADSGFEAIVDSVISMEMKKNDYHPKQRFFIGCSKGDCYLNSRYDNGDYIYISPDNNISIYSENDVGVLQQRGHTIVVSNNNDSLFNRLFRIGRAKMKIDFLDEWTVVYDYDTWIFKYENGDIEFIEEIIY